MIDGFHWTRVTAKQLRFLYEEVTMVPPPPQMSQLAVAIDRALDAIARPQPPNAADEADEPSRL